MKYHVICTFFLYLLKNNYKILICVMADDSRHVQFRDGHE